MTARREILVATDFSDCSAAAVEHASRAAVESAGRLHILHVLPARGRGAESLADDRRRALERLAQVIRPEIELGVTTVKDVVVGPPAEAIVAYARGHAIDLIVIGTHGRTGIARLALGSVAQRVLRDAPCEVSVVRSVAPPHSQAGGDPATVEEGGGVEPLGMESPALDLIERARRLGATDVHIDPVSDAATSVRLRIDGHLLHYCTLEPVVASHLVNRLKTLADLDISAGIRPLEGRLRLPDGMDETEVRITTAPVAGGEAVALRLLVRSRVFLPLEHLGMSESDLEATRGMIRSVEGLVVVSGPTGSGKTTFAYSMLESLAASGDHGADRVMTSIEDPVELAVPFMRQMETNAKQGITFASGLRTLLRMDPDVIFVGEIRDQDTAAVAMQAANSGRYVVSTMHARSAVSTITALVGMGLDRRLLSTNLTGIVNVRLVRRLCPECRRAEPPDPGQVEAFAAAGVESPQRVYLPQGCHACRRTGYRGRIGLFEVATLGTEARDCLAGEADERRLTRLLFDAGTRPLLSDALHKAAAGIVDYREATGVHWLA
jgi:type II secretory ATPase GspE/PulE/Tfp pilus assembly ATPase PilB-like protein/nucleotide-binding universal stress UspA family protein